MRIVALAFMFLLLGIITKAHEEQTIPYIYYYAPAVQAIVVERADGTDSRIFAPAPNGVESITKPGWSPSGKWFAWLDGNGYAWRVDGQANINLLRDYFPTSQWISHVFWMPDQNQDILLISGLGKGNINPVFVAPYPTDYTIANFVLLDVNTGKILAQVTNHVSSRPNFQELDWSNKKQVTFAIIEGIDSLISQFTSITMTLDGTVTKTIVPNCCELGGASDESISATSPSGRYTLFIDHWGISTGFINNTTDEIAYFPPASTSWNDKFAGIISFSSYDNWVFWYQKNPFPGGDAFGIFDIESGHWRELGVGYTIFDMFAWLPNSVAVAELAIGESESVLLAPVKRIKDPQDKEFGLIPSEPNVNYLMECAIGDLSWTLRPIEGEGANYQIQRETPCLEDRFFDSENEGIYFHPLALIVRVSPDGQLLATGQYNTLVSIWDAQTGAFIAQLNAHAARIKFNEDGNYLYTSSIFYWHIWDIQQILDHADRIKTLMGKFDN